MKPHIFLRHSWGDCGYEYQQWCCVTHKHFKLLPYEHLILRGLGATPEKAYDDWARMVNAEKVETL